jgi:uncharacterized protein
MTWVSKSSRTLSTDSWDVLVVGAGPAGLFAAVALTSLRGLRVLVIDAGRDIEERRHRGARRRDPGDDLIFGVGGAGLFSDGKLCMSLGVGGDLSSVVAGDAERLLSIIAAGLGVQATEQMSEAALVDKRTAEALDAGLEFGYYPVTHIGTDFCAERIRSLRDKFVHAGGSIWTDTRLQDLRRRSAPGHFEATVQIRDGRRQIRAARVVLALGKSGAPLQNELCRRLGAASTSIPMYVGLRLETTETALAPLFNGITDPKYKLHFDDGTKIKTHCAAQGGYVLPLRYEGLPLAGGHSYLRTGSGKSSLGVLWNGVRRPDAYAAALDLMRASSRASRGRLLVQRLCDYYARRPSRGMDVRRAYPSTRDWAPGDVTRALPSSFFVRFEEFLQALTRLAPGLQSDQTLLFAPAIEWWMNKILTDERMETAVPGLYVAGDGSGWSQGIVHAAATGVICAEAIAGARLRPDMLAAIPTEGRSRSSVA